MAIRIDKDKIVFPDGTEQVTAGGGTPPNVYTKSEVDAQQNAQDVNINKNTTDIANVYTKAEVNAQQQTQDVEIATKLSDAPDDGETYARNNKTWVSISDTSGIPDAPVDGEMYGRKDGEWSVVADSDDVYTKTETNNLLDDKADKSTTYTKSEVDLSQQSQDSLIQANADAIANLPTPVDTYTKAEIDASQNAQDTLIQKNADDIANIPAPVDTYTKSEIDAQQETQDTEIETNATDIADNKLEIAQNAVAINANTIAINDKADKSNTYTKTETNTLLDSKANVGDSYLKNETYTNTEIDTKLFTKADKSDTYTKDEVNELIEVGSGAIVGNYKANYPGNVARDPEAGNLYLVDTMSFTNNYDEVTTLYISTTDADGTVRDLSQIADGDVINLESANGSGSYTIQSFSDAGAYFEIIVDRGNCTGTLAQDDDVTARLEVTGGGSGSGTKLQVKSSKNSTRTTQTNTGVWEDTGLEVKITPASADNQVWLSFSAGLGNTSSSANNSVRLVRNSDELVVYKRVSFNGAGHSNSQQSFQFLDTPNSTTELTYKLQTKTDNGELRFNDTDSGTASTSTATAIEIGDVSSGGGDYTPEAMVWEDKKSERAFNTEYTNNNNVPIYLSVNTTYKADGTSSAPYLTLYINGEKFGSEGLGYTSVTGDTTDSSLFQTTTFVVPAGNTYELRAFNDTTLNQWKEAKMPVAVGTGGGDYTPEALVWVDKTSERELGTEYTNTNDVPLYMQPLLKTIDVDGFAQLFIDGQLQSTVGNGSAVNGLYFNSPLFIIPAGSKYKLIPSNNTSLDKWSEARMPVAVGTGGGSGGDSVWEVTGGGNAKYDGAVISTSYYKSADDGLQLRDGAVSVSRVDNDLVLSTASTERLKVGADGSILINGQPLAWTQSGNDLFYVSPNTDSGVYINSQESKNINIVGYNGTEANDLWLRSGGAPNTGLGIRTDGSVTFKDTEIKFAKTGAENFGAITLNGSGGTASSLGFVCNDYEGFWLDGQGRFRSPSIRDNTTVSPANIYINPDNGQIERSTTSLYTAEEVDKKLAIKDKLIEKLSARLDELEKRVK